MRQYLQYVLFICCINVFIVGSTNGQRGNIWYFGNYSGINFNGGIANPIVGGKIMSDEGTASVCDNYGNLLFYTDGVTVYDRTHSIMLNGTGLKGNQSSVHAALIVPKPGSNTNYYIFTSDADGSPSRFGYNYSEVDMTLNNGLGGITSNKNILLYINSTERIAAIKNRNGNDYWLLTKELGTNRFLNYRVTCSGVDLTPVVSSVGIIHSLDPIFHNGGRGAMKISPSGDKICVAIMEAGLAQLFDFDDSTGVLTNPIDLDGYVPGGGNIYGVEFSPDGALLYVSDRAGLSINQYDISSGNASVINSSKTTIISTLAPYALQIGPDSKIYVAHLNSPSLGVINSPNNLGVSCNYNAASFSLNGNTSAAGLPSFPTNFFVNKWQFDFMYGFTGCKVRFECRGIISNDKKLNWNFGDGVVDTGRYVFHSYRKAGKYLVLLEVIGKDICGSVDTVRLEKEINVGDVIDPGFSFSPPCVGDSIYFADTSTTTNGSITGWNWDFGDGTSSFLQNPTHYFRDYGEYKVKLVISSNGVCRSDSITRIIKVQTKPDVFFWRNGGCIGEDILFRDSSINLSGDINRFIWRFSNGEERDGKNIMVRFDSAKQYGLSLTVFTEMGCSSRREDSLFIESPPVVDFDFDSVCAGVGVRFVNKSKKTVGELFEWRWLIDDNVTSRLYEPNYIYPTAGVKTVTLYATTKNGCTASKTRQFNVYQVIANAGRDTTVLTGSTFQLMAEGGGAYEWYPSRFLSNASSSSPFCTPLEDIVYVLKVYNQYGCIDQDSIEVKVIKGIGVFVPNAFTPNDDLKNDVLRPILRGIKEVRYFRIFNRWGQLVYATSSLTAGWDGKIRGVPAMNGNYVWAIEAVDINNKVIRLTGSTLLLK